MPDDSDVPQVKVTAGENGHFIVNWPNMPPARPPRIPVGSIDLVGPLKFAVQDLADPSADAPGDGINGVILDLGGVEYMNSAGIGAIFALRKYAESRGAAMVVARPATTISRLLDTVNLPALIPVAEDLDAARQLLGKSE